jgi:hypothetical protein
MMAESRNNGTRRGGRFMQRRGKHVSTATNTHGIIYKLLEEALRDFQNFFHFHSIGILHEVNRECLYEI